MCHLHPKNTHLCIQIFQGYKNRLTERSSILTSLGGACRSEGGLISASTALGDGGGGSGEGVLAFANCSVGKKNLTTYPHFSHCSCTHAFYQATDL